MRNLAAAIAAVMIAAFVVNGCDQSGDQVASSKGAAATTTPPAFDFRAYLEGLREQIRGLPNSDPAVIARIDGVLSVLDRPEVFDNHVYLLMAIVTPDRPVHADLCRATGVAKVGDLPEVELLGPDGKLIERFLSPKSGWGANRPGQVMTFEVVFYAVEAPVTPSTASTQTTSGAGPDIPALEVHDKVVRLPQGVRAKECAVRMVFADGRSTEALRLFERE